MKKIILSLLGIILFLWIVLSVGPDTIAASMLKLNPLVFLLALAILLPSLALKGAKQQLLVSPFKSHTPLLENMKIWLVGFFFGTASPAKSGDAIRALYMKKNFGLSLGEGLAAVFVERALDLAFLFAFAFVGFFFLAVPAEAGSPVLFSLVLFFAVFVIALALLLRKEFTRFFLRPFFNIFAPEKFKVGIKGGFNNFYQAISLYRKEKKLSFVVSLLTIVSWFIVFFQLYVIASALSIEIPFFPFISILPVILLIEALPISFSGLGTREAASIVMLGCLALHQQLQCLSL